VTSVTVKQQQQQQQIELLGVATSRTLTDPERVPARVPIPPEIARVGVGVGWQCPAHNVSYVIYGPGGWEIDESRANRGYAEARAGGVLYYCTQMLSLFCTRLARCVGW
jgi:hypothetical protein